MAQMSAMQKNFIESNKMLYDNMPEPGTQEEPVTSSERSAETSGGKLSALLFVLIEKLLLLNLISYFYFFSSAMEQRELCIAFGPLRGPTPAEREVLTCILCQEEQEVMPLAPAMVLTACVQRSTVLTQCRGRIPANRSDGQCLSVLGIPAILMQMVGAAAVVQLVCLVTANQTSDPSWPTEYKNRERKFSDGITEMLVVCATTVHRVGLKTAPNELCPRVPLMAWNTCAFTIQAIGTLNTCLQRLV
ncbi:hypothetical protein XENOCAPTIV_017261 [Xenoophorus captivus]|uniref:E3 ubiquitin-protein ligase n=1 Tax=Xenoophorus captivus TaxID=1517983 RepID=A0ABV0QM26_9TELE